MAFGKICTVSLSAPESTLWHSPTPGIHRVRRGTQQGLLCLPGGISSSERDTQKPSRLAGGDTFETAASSAAARLAGISRSSWLEAALSSFNVLLKGENILISTLLGPHGTVLLP